LLREKIEEQLEFGDADKRLFVSKLLTIIVLVLYIGTYLIFPFGYRAVPVDDVTLYQYQDITKDDLNLLEVKLLLPTQETFNSLESTEYSLVYSDYRSLSTEEYIKKYGSSSTIGDQIVLTSDTIGLVLNGRAFSQTLPVVMSTKAELGYDGEVQTGDILDTSKIYLDVEYENGEKKQYTMDSFTIEDTDDLIIRAGINTFTVKYAGETFLLAISA
jgi:hypothetical protein